MATVLFVCLHNAGRSQMSQALFERAANGRHKALSAGTTPAEYVHPEVVKVMQELGIDLSDRRPQLLTQGLAEQADVVVTMGCGDACPYIPGKRYIDWNLPDPKQRLLQEVRATREGIQRRVTALAAELPSRVSLGRLYPYVGRNRLAYPIPILSTYRKKGKKGWMLRYIAGGIVMVLIGVLVAVLLVGRRQDRGVL